MTLVKWNHEDNRMPVFSRLMNNVFDDDLDYFFGNSSFRRMPSVNIIEGKEDFKIEVAAPGLEKNDFKLNLENNMLTIEANKEFKKEQKDERYARREFCYNSFQRSFTLPELVESDKIDAKYENGILQISIPKKEEAKVKPARQISIA
jgi:HSP20 family protein